MGGSATFSTGGNGYDFRPGAATKSAKVYAKADGRQFTRHLHGGPKPPVGEKMYSDIKARQKITKPRACSKI